jgi:phage shock protein A
MTDSLRTRVSQIVIGSAHALLDKIEDQAPEAMMEQAIRKVDAVIDEVRAELGKAAANRHLAQRQHADLNQRHLELTTQAEEAIAMNRDDLTRAAVTKQLDIEAQIPIVEGSLTELIAQEKELSGFVDALLGKRRDMQSALEQFVASRARINSAAGLSAAGNNINNAQTKVEKAGDAFNRVFQRQTGLSAIDKKMSATQEAQLRELDGLMQNQKIEARMAQLKVTKS